MTKPYWGSGGLAVLAVLAAVGLAACGGSSPSHVASLGHTIGADSGATATTLPKGNPTQLLDEWASCERANGVPDMTDPTITSSGAIHITLPDDANSSTSQSFDPSHGKCGPYLTAASQDLRGGSRYSGRTRPRCSSTHSACNPTGSPSSPTQTQAGACRCRSLPAAR